VRVLTDNEAEQAVNEAAASLPDSRDHSGGSHPPGSRRSEHSSSGRRGPIVSGNTSGGHVVPHLTNPGCLVQVMPTDAVLEPG
jgi:hypothetical protein